MKKFGMLVAMGLMVVGLFGGCSNGAASCKESCESDSDCGSGMRCFNTSSGNQCLPDECNACFDDGSGRCNIEENHAEQQSEGAERTCEFVQCT